MQEECNIESISIMENTIVKTNDAQLYVLLNCPYMINQIILVDKKAPKVKTRLAGFRRWQEHLAETHLTFSHQTER